MYPPGLQKTQTFGRNGLLQCGSFRYFWGKSRNQDGRTKSDIDILERLEGIG